MSVPSCMQRSLLPIMRRQLVMRTMAAARANDAHKVGGGGWGGVEGAFCVRMLDSLSPFLGGLEPTNQSDHNPNPNFNPNALRQSQPPITTPTPTQTTTGLVRKGVCRLPHRHSRRPHSRRRLGRPAPAVPYRHPPSGGRGEPDGPQGALGGGAAGGHLPGWEGCVDGFG